MPSIGVAIFHRPAAHAQSSPTTAPAPLKFMQAAPILPVRNLTQSVDFYTTKLGFKREWDYGDPVALVCVGRDQHCIYLSQAGEGAPRSSVYVHVSDVNAMLRDIAANGVLPIEGPVDRAWGMREMIVEDPDGHRLRIGSIYDASALPSEKRK